MTHPADHFPRKTRAIPAPDWKSTPRLKIGGPSRFGLVQFLLDRGADVNLVAGNGSTPLDISEAAGARRIADLLRRHGAKRAEDL